MKKYYEIISSVTASEAFAEASKEELRAIVMLLEGSGAPLSFEDVSRIAGISTSRARSAIAFWEGAGVLEVRPATATDGNIAEVFERRSLDADTLDMTGLEAAREIRNANLSDAIEQCAQMLGKPALNTEDVKRIVALHNEYGFDPEYILILAAFVVSRLKSPNVAAIVRKGKSMYDRDINTVEKLEAYVKDYEERVFGEAELKRAFGIQYPLSKEQKEYVKKWLTDYGFSLQVVGEAYDMTVNNINKPDFRYIDAIIESWHEAGCITVEDCRKKLEEDRLKKKQDAAAKRTKKKPDPQKPRYGNFDPDEAFAMALERSYGHLNNKDNQ